MKNTLPKPGKRNIRTALMALRTKPGKSLPALTKLLKIKPDKELIQLAEDISKNFSKLKPGEYVSGKLGNGKYRVVLKTKILNKYSGTGSLTPSRVSNLTGIIELNKSGLKKYPDAFIFVQIIWCAIMYKLAIEQSLGSSDETHIEADRIVAKFYFTKDRDKKEKESIVHAWFDLFKRVPTPLNKKRADSLSKYIK